MPILLRSSEQEIHEGIMCARDAYNEHYGNTEFGCSLGGWSEAESNPEQFQGCPRLFQG